MLHQRHSFVFLFFLLHNKLNESVPCEIFQDGCSFSHGVGDEAEISITNSR